MTSATDVDSGVTSATEYDALGRPVKSIAAVGTPLEIWTQTEYDDINRRVIVRSDLETKGDGKKVAVQHHDQLGRVLLSRLIAGLTQYSHVSATEYLAFDILGRVTSHKQTTDSTDYTTGYTYNLSGALIEHTYPSGRVVKNTIDTADGSLSQVQSKRSGETYRNFANGFNYNAAGAVTSMRLGNGLWETAQFNSRLQPTQIGLGLGSATPNKLKLDYTYGTTANNGNVMSQTITVPGVTHPFVQTYTYDELNRISNAEETSNSVQTWEQTFIYDRYGNRNFDEANTTTLVKNCGSSPNFTVCAADRKIVNPGFETNNRLESDDDYVFDNAGNTTEDALGRTFVYDAENKQIEVIDNSVTVGEYSYDGDGKRIKKHVPATGELTVFIYDAAGKLIEEHSTIVQTGVNAKTVYTTNDHLGSPRINTDAIGQVISRHDYHPFGDEITRSGYGSDTIRKQFTGYERDTETGLDFAQARYHNFNLGRFNSADPIMITKERLADPQAINLYVYVRNNPLIYIDPSGEEFKGKDGKKVKIEERDGQLVILSDNATDDLTRLVGLINNAGSSTALSQFNRLNAHKTMINFAFGDKDPQGYAGGRHQPHGSNGALKFENGKFEGQVDIVKDDNGNEIYREATITIYEGMYRPTAEGDSVDDQMVATFGHEAEHDLDPKQVQETKNKSYRNEIYHPENADRTPVTGSPYWMNQQIIREIREFGRRQKCPSGHMCF